MGFAAEDAKRVARGGKGSDAALRSELVKTQKVLDDLDRFCTRSELRPEVAVAMFLGYPKKVDEVAERVGARPGSFARDAVIAGLKRGQTIKKLVSAVQITSGVVSSIIVGAVTGGVGGVAAGALFSAGTSAITGAPDMVTAVNEEKRAKAAESLGLMSKGAGAAAQRKREWATYKYLGGIGLSAGGGGVAGKVGETAGRATEAAKLAPEGTAAAEAAERIAQVATARSQAAGIGASLAPDSTVQGVDAVQKAKNPASRWNVLPAPLP